ncbi:uncharacterized protein ARMOST_00013 [Armillaria ostoyae]|uniref:HECT domain-containing protein n=1 Tax=Armillaria ostoyae TaxID=47428 RepID=A0A284QJY2_ARMOS|nr:uncharacterized protein ARMOST_00013 [Armillaria ostoyae]
MLQTGNNDNARRSAGRNRSDLCHNTSSSSRSGVPQGFYSQPPQSSRMRPPIVSIPQGPNPFAAQTSSRRGAGSRRVEGEKNLVRKWNVNVVIEPAYMKEIPEKHQPHMPIPDKQAVFFQRAVDLELGFQLDVDARPGDLVVSKLDTPLNDFMRVHGLAFIEVSSTFILPTDCHLLWDILLTKTTRTGTKGPKLTECEATEQLTFRELECKLLKCTRPGLHFLIVISGRFQQICGPLEHSGHHFCLSDRLWNGFKTSSMSEDIDEEIPCQFDCSDTVFELTVSSTTMGQSSPVARALSNPTTERESGRRRSHRRSGSSLASTPSSPSPDLSPSNGVVTLPSSSSSSLSTSTVSVVNVSASASSSSSAVISTTASAVISTTASNVVSTTASIASTTAVAPTSQLTDTVSTSMTTILQEQSDDEDLLALISNPTPALDDWKSSVYTHMHDCIAENLYVEDDTIENAANLLYSDLHAFVNSLPSPPRPLDGAIHHLRRESPISRTRIFFAGPANGPGMEWAVLGALLKRMVTSFGWMALGDELFTLSPINVPPSTGELQTLRTQGLIVLLSLMWSTNILPCSPWLVSYALNGSFTSAIDASIAEVLDTELASRFAVLSTPSLQASPLYEYLLQEYVHISREQLQQFSDEQQVAVRHQISLGIQFGCPDPDLQPNFIKRINAFCSGFLFEIFDSGKSIKDVFSQDQANISVILREMLAGQWVTDPAQVARLLQPLNHQSFNADFFRSPQLASDRKKFIKMLRQWIRQSTIASCQSFIRVMTGSEYLPAGGGRSIDVVFYPSGFSSSTFNDVGMAIHMCSYTVDVLFNEHMRNIMQTRTEDLPAIFSAFFEDVFNTV